MYFYLNNFTKSKLSSVFVAEIKTISAKRLELFILCFKLAMINVKKMSKLGITKQHFIIMLNHGLLKVDGLTFHIITKKLDVQNFQLQTCFINSL